MRTRLVFAETVTYLVPLRELFLARGTTFGCQNRSGGTDFGSQNWSGLTTFGGDGFWCNSPITYTYITHAHIPHAFLNALSILKLAIHACHSVVSLLNVHITTADTFSRLS